MIVKFNRSNDQYRIEVKDYSEYNNDQDGWDAGQPSSIPRSFPAISPISSA